jgi:hypothetical protein
MSARRVLYDFLCSAFYGQHMQRAGCDARAPECSSDRSPPVGQSAAREAGSVPFGSASQLKFDPLHIPNQ